MTFELTIATRTTVAQVARMADEHKVARGREDTVPVIKGFQESVSGKGGRVPEAGTTARVGWQIASI